MKKLLWRVWIGIVIVFTALSLLPCLMMLVCSFASPAEVTRHFGMAFGNGGGSSYASLLLLPKLFSLGQYRSALFGQPGYWVAFWNSVLLSGAILLGMLPVSLVSGYALAKFRFPLRRFTLLLYILLMLLPYQIFLVPNYISLYSLGLLGKRLSVILPAMFSTYGVFLTAQFLTKIPDEELESARLDGAGEWTVLWHIVAPQSLPAMASVGILSLIDTWNLVEQPLIFLQDETKYPLSVQLTYITETDVGIVFACGTIFLIPLLIVFLLCRSYLAQGIQQSVL